MQSYNEYLVKQIENTNVEFERFMKNRNYTLTLVTVVTTIFSTKTSNSVEYVFVFVAIITLIYLLSILSINFKIRYIDIAEFYKDEERLVDYLIECNTYISDCYNTMFNYTVLYVLLVILSICLNTVSYVK